MKNKKNIVWLNRNRYIPSPNTDNEEVKYTSQLSKELLASQMEFNHSLNNKAGIILNMLAVFIPIYLFVIDHSNPIIKYVSIAVIISFILGIICMFKVLNIYTYNIGISESKYAEFINKSTTDIHLYEISANKGCIEANDLIRKTQITWYKWGSRFVIFSIISATILLTLSIFKEEITIMAKRKVTTPKLELPVVPQSELKKFQGNKVEKTDSTVKPKVIGKKK